MTEITARLSTALANRYRLERHLGEGGMATVYLAQDLKHERKVAVKVLRPELAAILGGERFLNEIKVTANLQHPNILPLYDSGEAETFLYYVMPFMEGESLRDKMQRERQLPVEETVAIAKDVADALQFAHERGIVHRDIKPENILLQSGRPLVADFGIALAISHAGGTRLTETGLSLGTPHYMSPEQATGDRELDVRSDVYSLGAMVYEMLTGDPPHLGGSVQAIVAKILSEKPSPITQARDMVPVNVDAAVQKALAKSPADRFASAAKFAEALTNPTFTLATAAGTVPVGAAAWGRGAGRLNRALAGLVVLLLGTTLWGWLRPGSSADPVARYSIALPEDQELRPRFGNRLAVSPDGSRMVYVGEGSGGVRLWLRSRDLLDATPIPGSEEAWNPTFSPDGSRVAFITDNPTSIRIVSLAGGPPITVADSGVTFSGISWGVDGFLYASGGGGLVRVPESGGVPTPVSTLDTAAGELGHGWPHALPNGKGVVFSARRASLNEWDIAVLDVASGVHRTLVRGVAAQYAASGHLAFVTSDGALLAAAFDLGRMELAGDPVALVEGIGVRTLGSVDLSISRTGLLAYVTGSSSGGVGRVVWVSRDGVVAPVDPDWTFDPGQPEIGVELSPDGTQLALKISSDAGPDVWVKQLDRGPLSRLTFYDGEDFRPRWSADGRHIMFISDRAGQRDLWVRRADGTGPPEVLLDLGQPILEVQRTRDEEWFVLRLGGAQGVTGVRDLVGLRQGDSVTVPIAAEPYDEKGAALSFDGRWLAYESTETGRNEVYVRPFPNASDGKWQVSTNGGINPRWGHNGRELFFVDGEGNMAVAAVETGAVFRIGERQVLFSAVENDIFQSANYAGWDVSADDQRFLMVQIGGESAGQRNDLIMVENWFGELRERAPRR